MHLWQTSPIPSPGNIYKGLGLQCVFKNGSVRMISLSLKPGASLNNACQSRCAELSSDRNFQQSFLCEIVDWLHSPSHPSSPHMENRAAFRSLSTASCRSFVWRPLVGLWNAVSCYLLWLMRKGAVDFPMTWFCVILGVGDCRRWGVIFWCKTQKQRRLQNRVFMEKQSLKSASCITKYFQIADRRINYLKMYG